MTVRRISFKNSLFRAVFLLLTLLMLGCATARADALRAVRERGVLRVGATGDYRPMSFRDPATGAYEGFDAALAEDLARELGVRLEYVRTSWPTLMRDTLERKFDLALCGITITPGRKRVALMSVGYLGNGKTVLCRAEDAGRYTSLAAINRPEVRVMENPGGLNERFVRAHLPRAALIIHPVNEEIPGLIASGKADVMITEIMEAAYYVARDRRLAAPLLDAPFTRGELGFLLPPGSETLLEYVNGFILRERRSGRLEELKRRYLHMGQGRGGGPGATTTTHTGGFSMNDDHETDGRTGITESAAVSNLTDLPLPYRQFVFGADRPGKYSLLLFLHGAGERGSDNECTKRNAVGRISRYILDNRLKVVMLVPQCPEGMRWVERPWGAASHRMPSQPSRPLHAALTLLDVKTVEFAADPAQTRVCGISMGGYGTWDAICRRPGYFAAAFAVCGGGDEAQAPKLRDMNITVFHGAVDPTVPVSRSRNMVEALRRAGNTNVLYVELPGVGHCSWELAFGDRAAMDKFFSALPR